MDINVEVEVSQRKEFKMFEEGTMFRLFINFLNNTCSTQPHSHPFIILNSDKPGYIKALITTGKATKRCKYYTRLPSKKCKCLYNRQLPDEDFVFKEITCVELYQVYYIEIFEELIDYILETGKKITKLDFDYIKQQNYEYSISNSQTSIILTKQEMQSSNYALHRKHKVI